MAFIEACIASQAKGAWVDVATKPRPSHVRRTRPRCAARRYARRYFIRLGSQSEIAGMYVTSRSARHIAP
jgi:hypothetical protein